MQLKKAPFTGYLTDDEGKFKLENDFKPGDKIIFSYVGFESKTYQIPKDAPNEMYITIEFKRSDLQFLGEVAIEEVYTSKPKLWQRLKNKFK